MGENRLEFLKKKMRSYSQKMAEKITAGKWQHEKFCPCDKNNRVLAKLYKKLF